MFPPNLLDILSLLRKFCRKKMIIFLGKISCIHYIICAIGKKIFSKKNVCYAMKAFSQRRFVPRDLYPGDLYPVHISGWLFFINLQH